MLGILYNANNNVSYAMLRTIDIMLARYFTGNRQIEVYISQEACSFRMILKFSF